MNILNIILVFIGGMCGAALRYEWSRRMNKQNNYWGTAFANVSGGLLLGALIRINQETGMYEWLWLFLATGFCGGYTTYSTFSYEVFQVYREGNRVKALFYTFASIAVTILGILLVLKL